MKHLLKVTFRFLVKNRMISAINFFGLVVGFFTCILISQYILFELSFDEFHDDSENKYRLSFQRIEDSEETLHAATTFLPVGEVLMEELPDVKERCRFYYPFTHGVINIGSESYFADKPVFADASFFEMFAFHLLEGNKEKALSEPNRVVLSQELAQAYFGNENPLGKSLDFSFEDGSTTLVVAGVMENPRQDSHIKLDLLISFRTLQQWSIFQDNAWTLPFYHTYVHLNQETDIQKFEANATQILLKYRPNEGREGFEEKILLQPIEDIHLYSDLRFELGLNGDSQSIYFMGIVAILILVIVYLNYVNFTVAISSVRAKEVGVRKIMGSSRRILVLRFVQESLLFNLVSFLVSAGLALLLTDAIVKVTDTYFELTEDVSYWLLLLAIVIVGSVLSNLYPATLSSNFTPVRMLRGDFSLNAGGGMLRRILISLQFAITVLVIGGVVIISNQTSFLLEKDLGFDADQLVVINAPRNMSATNFQSTLASFEDELLSHSAIHSFTSSGSVPGKVMGSGTIRRAEDTSSEGTALQFNLVGYDFFSTYGLAVEEGRVFDRSVQSDAIKVVVNEATVSALGYTDKNEAIGSKIVAGGREFEILGVVSNYHHSSLKINFEPIVFVLSPTRMVYLSIRLNTKQLRQTLAFVESNLKAYFPDHPFEYFFLDEAFQREFKKELRFAGLLKNFSILAIILASLGLYGLSTFLIYQRSKEIGIRKLLGATTQNFAHLMSAFFVKPLVVGSVLACALLYYFGNAWLQTFPFRIDIQWYVFAIPLSVVCTITIVSLLQLIIKTNRVEPVDMLRDE